MLCVSSVRRRRRQRSYRRRRSDSAARIARRRSIISGSLLTRSAHTAERISRRNRRAAFVTHRHIPTTQLLIVSNQSKLASVKFPKSRSILSRADQGFRVLIYLAFPIYLTT